MSTSIGEQNGKTLNYITLTRLAVNAYEIGLQIKTKRTKIMTNNASQFPQVQLLGETLEHIRSFCYWASINDDKSGTDADISNRISKANKAFGILN